MRLPDWLGFRSKTLWDWLQLLIVPAILIAVTFAWSATQTRIDDRREDRRSQDVMLQAYLDQMSRLMLDKGLLSSKQGEPVRAVARTVTLTALRGMDVERKAAVVRFLNEARLLEGDEDKAPLVWLQGADLSGANLRRAELSGAVLFDVDLTDADLTGADLNSANLVNSSLRHAQLSRATLAATDLRGADLTGADLSAADLVDTVFGGAYLTDANLRGAERLAEAKFVSNDAIFGYLLAHDLDLHGVITDLPSDEQKEFLNAQKKFLDSLSPRELTTFNLTPEKLAKLRREANGG
jgi:uncharacterized protein YjbI with pentapeptide repeats